MAVTAKHPLVVLVRHEEKKISWLHWPIPDLVNVVLHGDAFGDGHRKLDGFPWGQGMTTTALHAQKTAADIDMVLDDVAEEHAFDDGALEEIGLNRRIGLSENDRLRADRNRHFARRCRACR